MRSLISWYGGKFYMVKHILDILPEHKIYIEPFGGGAQLLFAKDPSPIEVYNDLHGGVVNLFRVVRDKEQFKEFKRLCSLTPYSREEFYNCRDKWKYQKDPVEKARMFYVVCRQSFGGDHKGWAFSKKVSDRKMCQTTSKWLSTIDRMEEIHQRLQVVQIENNHWQTVVDTYDNEKTLFYLDPPYMKNSRVTTASDYVFEMSNREHENLIHRITSIKGYVILSGYKNHIYAPLVNHFEWNMKEFKSQTYSSTKRSTRTECLWYNFDLDD